MSEQTPDPSADLDADLMSSGPDEAEPSMEDILASIRKIIAEDSDPDEFEPPVETPAPSRSASLSPLRRSRSADEKPLSFPAELVSSNETLASPTADKTREPLMPMTSLTPLSQTERDGRSDVFDIDALLNDIDLAEPELPPLAIPEINMDDEPVALEIPMMPEAPAAQADETGGDAVATTDAGRSDRVETDDEFFSRVLGLGDESNDPDLSSPDRLDLRARSVEGPVDASVDHSGETFADDEQLIDMLLSHDLTQAEAGTSQSPAANEVDQGSPEDDIMSILTETPIELPSLETSTAELPPLDVAPSSDVSQDETSQNEISPADDALSLEAALSVETDTVFEPLERPSAVNTDDDLELVKSLMADLTDGGRAADDDVGAHSTESDETVHAEVEGDILNDIFDMTLNDELLRGHDDDPIGASVQSSDALDVSDAAEASETVHASEPLEIEAAAIDVELELTPEAPAALDSAAPDSSDAASSGEPQTLAEIAAAAENDAQHAAARLTALSDSSEPNVAETLDAEQAPTEKQDPAQAPASGADGFVALTPAAAIAAAASVGAAIGAAHDHKAKVTATHHSDDARTKPQSVPNHSAPNHPNQEPPVKTRSEQPTSKETPMPSVIRKDVILDDVTEEATTIAFAELNSLVEEKAILEERGPRIGDLVQEALKPMLQEWLAANLKGIVERAVAKEVKRISSGK